ncbi:MAG TPA: hypothetical protein VKV73_21055 [Chloroflexota bacterium]|nr:hypothetical protein [Chloroflexota bacterium]
MSAPGPSGHRPAVWRTGPVLAGVALAVMLLAVGATQQPRVMAHIAGYVPMAGSAVAQEAPPADPSMAGVDPIIDDFQRDSLGDGWHIYNGNAGIVNGELGIVNKSGPMLGLGILAWQGAVLSADQFSEAVVAPDKDPDALLQVFVRRRTSDNQRYGFHWNPYAGGRWELKRDGGTPGIVLTTLAAPQRPGPGDVLRIEVVGSQITGIYNGNVMLTASDTDLTDAGQPGLALNIGLLTHLPAAFVTRWSGGSLSTS